MIRWLISAIGMAALKGEATAIAKRAARRALLFAVALLAWLVAVGFGVAALTVWLAAWLGMVPACCVIAAALLIIGLALFLGLALSGRRREKPFDRLAAGAAAAAPELGGLGGLGSIALIALAGYLLGRQIFRK